MIKFLKVSGTHYEVGHQVGKATKAEIESYIKRSAYVQEVMLPFYTSQAGAKLYEVTLASLRAQCPQYLAELEGVAAGAELPFNTIMMLNINCPAGSKAVLDKGCTTLMVPDSRGRCRVLGHTEDGPPEAEDCMAMLEITIPATGNLEAESFTALSYPGSLVGRALGFNSREGFAWSMNSTAPLSHAPGIPRQFLLRILAGQGLRAFLSSSQHLSNGCSVNIADAVTAVNIELANKMLSVSRLGPGEPLIHANKFRHLAVREVRDVHWESSAAREARLQAGRVTGERGLETEEDVCWWLGDTKGDLAIFRTKDTERDVLLTLATGVFNLDKGQLHLYTENPRHSEPGLRLEIEPRDCLQETLSSL